MEDENIELREIIKEYKSLAKEIMNFPLKQTSSRASNYGGGGGKDMAQRCE